MGRVLGAVRTLIAPRGPPSAQPRADKGMEILLEGDKSPKRCERDALLQLETGSRIARQDVV